jgi:hypothetical protein
MALLIRVIICFLIAALGASADWAAPPATQSSKIWELPGMTGTAAQITVELHQELDELNSKIAAAQGDVRSAQLDMQAHRAIAIAQFAKTNDANYRYVCDTFAEAQRELSTGTNKSRTEELRLKIEGFTKRRRAMEDQAVATNSDTPKFLAQIADKMATVNHLQNDLAKCFDWRCEIGDAVRGGMTLVWPAAAGSTGIIGELAITNIDPSGLITASGELFEPLSQDEKRTEGIVTVRGRDVPAIFSISGWKDDPVSVGEHIYMDETVRVISSEMSGEEVHVNAERLPSDDDAILRDFHDFRKPRQDDLASR